MGDGEICKSCGKVHKSKDEMDEREFISANVEGLGDALKALVMHEPGANPKMALAIAVGTAMRLAVEMRAKDMTQHEALEALAEDVKGMCQHHIDHVDADPERKAAMEEDHKLRQQRMGEIEAMLKQSGPLTELLMKGVQGNA